MSILRRTLTTSGTLLTAFLGFTGYAEAQAPPLILTTLYSLSGSPDGAYPDAGVAIGSGGVLYGTAHYGGTSEYGIVFSLTPPASPGGAWTETVLHSFAGGSDGASPYTPVVIGKGGVVYGTTWYGGTGPCAYGAFTGCGTVYSLTPPASMGGAWTEAVLHSFTGGSDGVNPGTLVIDSGGVLYGTTTYGGTSGAGTVFSLTPPASPGGAWTETVLHNFAGSPSDGSDPRYGRVVIASGGVLYGKTEYGGTSGAGTVFSLTPPASPGGAWTETVLYNFTGTSDGAYPSSVAVSSGGVLYGSTGAGGGISCYSGAYTCGTVFSLTPPATPGGAWTEAVLYDFTGTSSGTGPSGIVIGPAGVLYGVIGQPAISFPGLVFSLTPPASPGGTWTESVYPVYGPQGVAIGKGDVVYGATNAAGASYGGSVFSLSGFVLVPKISASPKKLTFPATPIDTPSAPLAVTITSSGSAPLVINGISISGTDAADFAQTDDCPAALPSGSSCTVNVVMTPLADGPLSAELAIDTNAVGGAVNPTLSGSGPDYTISANPASATVLAGASATSTITLTPEAGLTGTVKLGCSVPSGSGIACSFKPARVTLAGVPATSMATITTPATLASGSYKVTVFGTLTGLPARKTLLTLAVE